MNSGTLFQRSSWKSPDYKGKQILQYGQTQRHKINHYTKQAIVIYILIPIKGENEPENIFSDNFVNVTEFAECIYL